MVRAGRLVTLPAVPIPFLLASTPLLEGAWIDLTVLKLAEFGAILADRGRGLRGSGDAHPLASEEFVTTDARGGQVPMTCPPKTGPGSMLVIWPERGNQMASKRRTSEQIIAKLREAEVGLAQGQTVAQVCKAIGVTEQTFYRWRNEYGGLKLDQVKRLKQLEKENSRLRRAVADLTVDNQILKEAVEGNF